MERYANIDPCQIRLSMKKADLIEWFKEKKAPMPKGSGKEGRVLVRDLVEARKKFLSKGGEEETQEREEKAEEVDGISYELYKSKDDESKWWIRVVDVDSGEVATLVKYPSYDRAKEKFAETIKLAKEDQPSETRYEPAGPLVKVMAKALSRSLDELSSRIQNVRWGPIGREEEDVILFEIDGQTWRGKLQGRNKDLVVSGNPELDAKVALRTLVDNNAGPTTKAPTAKTSPEVKRISPSWVEQQETKLRHTRNPDPKKVAEIKEAKDHLRVKEAIEDLAHDRHGIIRSKYNFEDWIKQDPKTGKWKRFGAWQDVVDLVKDQAVVKWMLDELGGDPGKHEQLSKGLREALDEFPSMEKSRKYREMQRLLHGGRIEEVALLADDQLRQGFYPSKGVSKALAEIDDAYWESRGEK